jgi:predicted Fe-Mo cluster-binding NifX family protein
MKVAVPSDDRKTLAPHFGRTAGFLIFEVADSKIIHEQYRTNTFTNHVMGQQNQYGPHSPHDHDHQQGHGHHGHERILDALFDCEVVIAGGMGHRLQEDLAGAGKQIFITRQADARAAVELFLSNKLQSDKDACCGH